MGWNDSRVELLAPNWRQFVEEIPSTKTMEGRSLRLLDAVAQDSTEGQRIDAEAVKGWLQERGFRLEEDDADSARLTREDIEAFLEVEDGELAQIVLTFTLAPDSPSRWERWKELVEDLSEAWHLSLADTEHGTKLGVSELFRLLSETIAWREFERNFGWPTIASAAK
jgi:hypothetical protein